MPEIDEYQFTSSQDWFSHNVAVWGPLLTQLKTSLPSDRAPRALEIGSWEGRSATYLLRTLCTAPSSLLVCVDHFDLMRTEAGKQRRARLEHNLTVASGGVPRYRVMEDFSVPALMRLLEEEIEYSGGFDFVYVDGSHEADDTFLDAELAWRITAQGGLFVFDDYGWETEDPASIHHPKRGIDGFLALHDGQYETVYRGYQVILRRTAAPRIGFLSKSVSSTANELGYGMSVVLCVNEAYAIGAAVAIRSAVECTPNGRITVYVVDCGLADASYERLQQACGSQMGERVTMVRTSLPSHSRALEDPTWAKIDMFALLPVERVLYLDADVLVRKNLSELWSTDLQGRALGAARNIGHPLGHVGVWDEKRPYFNAGVMLLDLARIRQRSTTWSHYSASASRRSSRTRTR
ncbi:nucleotide-diphospho-sugar transferase [Exidia glandulosa HHB12029]|uniref:Nucleotide-diphospho-sugar transferase n=1 Tax=Exidia glandulosa HHB12029 TaxID=1314781 RepID=A0A165KT92_EXIGL|nr:nucleotide-diphospho-sugar transferase [Exidia glandulosa HHB12029]